MNATATTASSLWQAINLGYLANRTPVEIDTVLAALDAAYPALERTVSVVFNSLHKVAGDRKNRDRNSRSHWTMTNAEAEAECMKRRNGGDVSAADALIDLNRAILAVNTNRSEFSRLDAEYNRRGGWTRFVQCEHIHSGYHCAGGTLDRGQYRSERYWRPEFSGMDQSQAIATLQERAETLCTHCFPNAPVAPRALPEGECPGRSYDPAKPHHSGCSPWGHCLACGARVSATSTGTLRKHLTPAGEQAKAAAKQAAELADTKKMLFRGEVKTIISVQRRMTQIASDALWYGSATQTEAERAELVEGIAALAQKLGRTVEDLVAEVERKATASVKRAGGTPRA